MKNIFHPIQPLTFDFLYETILLSRAFPRVALKKGVMSLLL
jgi:hypothetical protein